MASTRSENLLLSHILYSLLSCQYFPCYQLTKSRHLSPSRVPHILALALHPRTGCRTREQQPQKWKHHLYGDPGKHVRTPRFIKWFSLNSSSSKSSRWPPVNQPDICRLWVFMFTQDALARAGSPQTRTLLQRRSLGTHPAVLQQKWHHATIW